MAGERLKWQPPTRREKESPLEDWSKQITKDMEEKDLESNDWRDKQAFRRGCERRSQAV